MVFKLAQAAQNSRRLDGHNQLPKLIVGVKFIAESKRQATTSSRRLTQTSPRFGYSPPPDHAPYVPIWSSVSACRSLCRPANSVT